MKAVGIGNSCAKLQVFNANRPDLIEFNELNGIKPLVEGEIVHIVAQTSNHWRKIFNCFAKLVFQLNPKKYASWQELRDLHLLQSTSQQQLLFSSPDTQYIKKHSEKIKLICGKQYFNQLNLAVPVSWVDAVFAVNSDLKLIVTPYFDYRQLTNQRIEQLTALIKQL